MHAHTHGASDSHAGLLIRWAHSYDLFTKLLFLGREGAFRESTLDLVPLERGQSVLDVGCGPGTLTLAAKKRVGDARVCGIDPSSEMLALAREKAARAGLPVEFTIAGAQSLPFDDASFDVVLSSMMLHHVPADLRTRALSEMHRVLRPGGTCLIVDLVVHGMGIASLLRRHHGAHGHSSEQIVGDLMRGAGFDVTTGPTSRRIIRYARGVKRAG